MSLHVLVERRGGVEALAAGRALEAAVARVVVEVLPKVELVHEALAAKLAGVRPLSRVLLHAMAVLLHD